MRPGQLIEALRHADAYPHPTGEIELISTHISYVLLTGEFAYKIKKPVRLPFVDFSTLESRRRSCEDELRLNRRISAELYLDVVPIGGSPDAPRVGATPAIEYAVKMHQFAPAQTLDRLLERRSIDVTDVCALADRIADFHGGLPPTHGRAPERVALDNFVALTTVADFAERRRLEAIGVWLRNAAAALAEEFRQRERDGCFRECHGDLHLGNLVWLHDRILPFDCLEFDIALRCIDTIDEVAFLVMDFMAHAREDLAYEFLNRYLEASGDYHGVRELRFYLVHRALVRSYVRLLSAADRTSSAHSPYLELAEQLVAERSPVLVITHGLSGSGKTTITNQLIGRLPAIRVRSDIERKRLQGMESTQRSGSGLGAGLYSHSKTDATYDALLAHARHALSAGVNIIIDAAFLERARRVAFAELAKRTGARFVILAVTAGEAVLRERVMERQERGGDASEAGVAVLEYQMQRVQPIGQAESGVVVAVDSSKPIDIQATVREILAR